MLTAIIFIIITLLYFLKNEKTENSNKGIVTKKKVKTIIKATAPASPKRYANNMGITVKRSARIRLKSAVCFPVSFLQKNGITNKFAIPNKNVIIRK